MTISAAILLGASLLGPPASAAPAKSNPFTGTWKDLTTVPLGEQGAFSGSVDIPVKRGIDNNGALQINFRAVVSTEKGDIYSNMTGFLIKAKYMKAGQWCMGIDKKFGTYCVGSPDGPRSLYRSTTKDGLQIVSWGKLVAT